MLEINNIFLACELDSPLHLWILCYWNYTEEIFIQKDFAKYILKIEINYTDLSL